MLNLPILCLGCYTALPAKPMTSACYWPPLNVMVMSQSDKVFIGQKFDELDKCLTKAVQLVLS